MNSSERKGLIVLIVIILLVSAYRLIRKEASQADFATPAFSVDTSSVVLRDSITPFELSDTVSHRAKKRKSAKSPSSKSKTKKSTPKVSPSYPARNPLNEPLN